MTSIEFEKLILSIKSPKNKVKGPFYVVKKNLKDKWAIVALTWSNKPRLGIRWFHGKKGTPLSSSYPIWFIIPPELYKSILADLNIAQTDYIQLMQFLDGKLDGYKLMKNKNN